MTCTVLGNRILQENSILMLRYQKCFKCLIHLFRWLLVRGLPSVQGARLQDADREVVCGAVPGGGVDGYATCPVFKTFHKLHYSLVITSVSEVH